MRTILMLALSACVSGVNACAQETANLDQTLKFLQENLNSQGRVQWVQTPEDKVAKKSYESVSVEVQLSDAVANTQSCALSFRMERSFPNYRLDFTWKVSLRDIGKVHVMSLADSVQRAGVQSGNPERGMSTVPTVFVVEIEAAQGKKFQAHRWSLNSSNEKIQADIEVKSATAVFDKEETAQRVSKALSKASELCGAKAQPAF